MSLLDDTIKGISPVDGALLAKAQRMLDILTKPQGSLGRLEDLAKNIAAITAVEHPVMERKVIFTFAADHGVTEEGISAFPKEVTAQMVYNFIRGGAAINVLSRHCGVKVVVADLGVAEDLGKHEGLINAKVDRGTKNMFKGPAMTLDQAKRSIEAGIEIFERSYKDGIDVAGTGEMGIGNTTAASAITSVITGATVRDVTGRGTGIDEKGLEHKISVIEGAIAKNRPDPGDGLDILAKVGGFEIGGLVGVILAAARRKVPVAVDGFISGAAALIAYKLQPLSRDYMIASHKSVERGHAVIWKYMGLKPVLDLDMRLGEGTGACLAMTLIEASCKILKEMATFESAKVSDKSG